ncbi:hypothetical protein D3C77_747210 [compost metagenome]
MAADEVGRLVADVQVDAVDAQTFHFVIYRAGHDIAWRQFLAWIEARHEAFAVG